MEGQGDLFEPEYLTYRPSDSTATRAFVIEQLQPFADQLNLHQANPLAVAEGFQFFANQFRAEAERQLTANE